MRQFKVVGIFKLGLYEFDSAYGFVHLDVAKIAVSKTQPTFIELRVRDLFKAQDVARSDSGAVSASDYVGAGLGGHEQVALLARCGSRRWPSRSRSA